MLNKCLLTKWTILFETVSSSGLVFIKDMRNTQVQNIWAGGDQTIEPSLSHFTAQGVQERGGESAPEHTTG